MKSPSAIMTKAPIARAVRVDSLMPAQDVTVVSSTKGSNNAENRQGKSEVADAISDEALRDALAAS